MPELCIALYRPHDGKADDLMKLVEQHLPLIRRLGLATERAAIHATAEDGTVLEIFEWADGAAAEKAHSDPDVAALWGAMAEIADFPTLGDIPEAATRFPHFRPLSL